MYICSYVFYFSSYRDIIYVLFCTFLLLNIARSTTPNTPRRITPDIGTKPSTVSPGISAATAPNVVSKTDAVYSTGTPAITAPRKNLPKIHATATPNTSFFKKSDISVIVPRNDTRGEQAAESRREGVSGKPTALSLQFRPSDFRKYSSAKDDSERASVSGQSESEVFGTNGFSGSGSSASPAVQSSSIRISAVESIVKDIRSTMPAKFQMNPASEPPSSYRHESCKW